MAKRVKGEVATIQAYLTQLSDTSFRIRNWDVNEMTLVFSPPTGASTEVVISIPDEYPSGRPFCFSDSADSEDLVTTLNDLAGQERTSLGNIVHKCLAVCLLRSGLPAPPPFVDSAAPAEAPAAESRTEDSYEEDGDEDSDENDNDGYSDAYFAAPAVTEPVEQKGQEVEGVRKLMERMRQTKDFATQGGSVQATDRLMKEFRALMKKDTAKDGFLAGLIEDNLYDWEVRVFGFDQKEPLARDLEEYKRRFGLDYLQLQFKFPQDYPHKPPFVRVVRPGIQGGYVLDGGALCMELLTPMGWSSAYSIDAVIPQLMATLVEGKARIIMQPHVNYDERAARATFDYIVETHKRDGWFTPPKSKG
eukprot:TRINITY_DN13433_c0_g1_i1.p1 TRINITY_DN13433_c0_g1~~TRINITY_DN13433_c0_g1_i1.p1  ORF type:complete len:362 (+),score=65.73 TRINITY_DN13433_c0_g1_i1:81-1166(+)